MRVFSLSAEPVTISEIEAWLTQMDFKAKVESDPGSDPDWEQIVLAHSDGMAIAPIERNPVVSGKLGEAEVQEFLDEIQESKPASAATWLTKYLKRVKTIYAFQILHAGSEREPGWDVVRHVYWQIMQTKGGVLHADGEGFTNEDGYHILWEFSDRVEGTWNMAVLDKNEKWLSFEMDLGNIAHRKAFLAGEVPHGIRVN